MSREVKFRGKSVIGWVHGYYAVIQDKFGIATPVIYANPFLTAIPVDENTVGQYAGLTDKTGKEIYEGDIVHWKDCEPIDDEIVYEDTFVIYWSDEFLMWKAKNECNDYIDLYDYSDNRELEVIGNICENKELLYE